MSELPCYLWFLILNLSFYGCVTMIWYMWFRFEIRGNNSIIRFFWRFYALVAACWIDKLLLSVWFFVYNYSMGNDNLEWRSRKLRFSLYLNFYFDWCPLLLLSISLLHSDMVVALPCCMRRLGSCTTGETETERRWQPSRTAKIL